MSKSLLELRNSLERLNDDITDVGASNFVEWCNLIADYIFPRVQNVEPEEFIQTQEYSVSSSPSSQSLPSNFGNIRINKTGLFLKDQNGNPTNQNLAPTGYGEGSRGYWLSRGLVNFTGINSLRTFVLRYMPKRTSFTDQGSDYFTVDGTQNGVEIIPDEQIEVVIKGLDVLHKQWDNDPGAESVADQRFVRIMSELFSDIKKTPNVYVVAQSTNAF